MSIDKKRIGKILKVTVIGTGVTFRIEYDYKEEKDQKNPFDENDEENVDGVRDHLEAVGETKKS